MYDMLPVHYSGYGVYSIIDAIRLLDLFINSLGSIIAILIFS